MSAVSLQSLFAKVARRLRRGTEEQRPEPVFPEPVFPEVVEERTNFGPAMDSLVTRVKRNQEPLGVDSDYDLLRENFDHMNFMLQAESLHELPDVDPIRIFLRHGARAVNSPDYNFSMRDYLDRQPERKRGPEQSPYLEWVKRGRDAGEIADPAHGIEKMAVVLGLQPNEVVDELVATRTDMMKRLRTGKLGEMFAKAVEIEPLVGAAWVETTRTRMLPLRGRFVVGQVAAIHACQEKAGFKRARLIVVTDRPHCDGGRGPVGHLAHVLAGTISPDEIVVIYTDESGAAPPGRLPQGVREIDFATATEGLPAEHKQQALVSLLRSFRADAIVNIDSAVLYEALAPYGKALAASERIYLYFLCNEQRAQGTWDGWSLKWFYAGSDFVEGFITDSDYLRDLLTDTYQLSERDRERIHVLRTPVQPEFTAATPTTVQPSRPVVRYWTGRWDRQRRVDIALEVARRMPDVDFLFWGDPPPRGTPVRDVPENVRLETHHGPVGELDSSPPDAWLYTSAWDGVPGLLLEVAMTETPIVGSLVGGVGEVLSEEDSWPVADWENPEAYEKALREILSDPATARWRSRALRERLERTRPQRALGEYAAALLLGQRDLAEETR